MSNKELFDTLLSNVVKIVGLVMKLVSAIETQKKIEDQKKLEQVIDVIDKISSHL